MRLGINIKGKIEKHAEDIEISISAFDTPEQIKMPDYNVTIKSGSEYDIFLPCGKCKIKFNQRTKTSKGIINQLTPVTILDVYDLMKSFSLFSDDVHQENLDFAIEKKNLEIEKLKREVESLSEQLRNALNGVHSVSDINMRIEMLTREHSGLFWEFKPGKLVTVDHQSLSSDLIKKEKGYVLYPTLKATIELD